MFEYHEACMSLSKFPKCNLRCSACTYTWANNVCIYLQFLCHITDALP